MNDGLTDEMRKWGRDMAFVNDNPRFAKRVDELCDNIYKEHEKMLSEQYDSLTVDMQPMTDENMAEVVGFCRRLEDAAAKHEDVEIFGVGYTALPMDADGEYIHVGDILLGYNDTATVKGLSLSEGGWELICDNGIWHDPEEFVHYHKPTVEEILQEFRDEVALGYVTKEVIDEFADRIRGTLQ